jgi:hypothetical protein
VAELEEKLRSNSSNTSRQAQAVVHADESSHKQKSQLQWTWVAIAQGVSVFLIQASRSAAAAKQLLGESFKGLLVSDRFSAYHWVDGFHRQVCWAHLRRDFKKIAERGGDSERIGRLLRFASGRMFGTWDRFKQGKLNSEQLQQRMAPLQKNIEDLLQQGADGEDTKTAATW